MQLIEVLIQNEGRDICICLEFPNGKRKSNILKKYTVLKKETYYCVESNGNSSVISIPQKIRMTKKDVGHIMTRIKAKCKDVKYHIYITDDIGEEVIRLNV